MWLKVLRNGIIYDTFQTTTLNKINCKKIVENTYYLLLYLYLFKKYMFKLS